MNILTIEGLISVKFIIRGEKAFQYFILSNKKGVRKYLIDNRFIVHDKFEEKIKSFALSNNPGFIFIERRDEEDRITLEFKIQDISKLEKLNNFYFVIPGFVPPSAGCSYCKYNKDNGDTFFYCDFKQKTLTNKLKNCQFFRQKEGLFKT